MSKTNLNEVERFVWQQMSAAERVIFEKKIAENPELLREIALLQTEKRVLEQMAEQKLRAKLSKLDAQFAEKQAPKLSVFWKYLGAASAIAACFALFFWLKSTPDLADQPTNPIALKNDLPPVISIEKKEIPIAEIPAKKSSKTAISVKKTPIIPKRRPVLVDLEKLAANPNLGNVQLLGDIPEIKTKFDEAQNAISQEKYADALTIVNQLDDQNLAAKQWLRGQIFFKTNDFLTAKTEFKQLINLHDANYQDLDEWMFVLASVCEKGRLDAETEPILAKIEQNRRHLAFRSAAKLRVLLSER
jgi:hypothetical protein